MGSPPSAGRGRYGRCCGAEFVSPTLLVALSGGPRRPHILHGPDRLWPETSCYVDLWIELLAALGHPPEAAFGFGLAVAYEGDQFTFLKPPLSDLEALFGLRVAELALWDGIEPHLLVQLARGRPVLLEVDAFHLPDTRGLTWHRSHTKTTIAITALDPLRRRLRYVHNRGWFEAEGEDVDGILRAGPRWEGRPELLPPYAELVEQGPRPAPDELTERALAVLRRHLDAAHRHDPIADWRLDLPNQLVRLLGEPMELFHRWAFNLPRQLGAAFELLAAHLAWLARADTIDLRPSIAPALDLARDAHTFEMRVARAVHRRRPIDPAPLLDRMQTARVACLELLDRALGGGR